MKETDLRKSSAFEIGPYALLMMAINVRREETANVIANSIVNHMLQEKTDFERIYDASNHICDKYIPGTI
jgi:hypothetical protein